MDESKTHRGGRWRYWLIAAIMVIAVVGLAAIVQVEHRSHPPRSSLETNAIGSLHTYHLAQEMYKQIDWGVDGSFEYAHPFPLLHTTLDAQRQAIQLIDRAFAEAVSADKPKHGYFFADMETIAGEPIDWRRDFALCAMPAIYGRTGYRTFIVRTDGRVWAKDFGREPVQLAMPTVANRDRPYFVADFPADPKAEGWVDPEAEPRLRRLTEKAVAVLSALTVIVAIALPVWLVSWLRRNPMHRFTRNLAVALTIVGVLVLLVLAVQVLSASLHVYR